MNINFLELSQPISLIGKEVQLLEVLASRDKRQFLQQECLDKHSCCLLSISLISPGGVKKNKLLEYIFDRALQVIVLFIDKNKITINEKIILNEDTGLYALFALEINPLSLKKHMIEIEESLPIARLWDLDVLDENGKIISRTEVDNNLPRKCLICDNNAKICARERKHSINEIYRKMQSLAAEDCFALNYTELANKSLLKELNLTPKPGLVDQKNSGSHKDMNYDTFIKSTESLKPFFYEFIINGMNLKYKTPEEVFFSARKIGINAEKSMFNATNGVNTHKGSIFSFGLVLSAIGYLYKQNIKIDENRISQFISEATISLINEFNNSDIKEETAGIRLFRKHQLKGARGEASSGYQTIMEHSLPIYIKYSNLDEDHRLAITLLKLISINDDTNIVNRGGTKELNWIKNHALNILSNPAIYENNNSIIKELNIFDALCIDKNISPGGSADLLALTYFFSKLNNY